MDIGISEAEPVWTDVLRKLTLRGLRGVKLVISNAPEGIKVAVSKVLSATWHRCRRRRENHFASQLIPRINCFCSNPD